MAPPAVEKKTRKKKMGTMLAANSGRRRRPRSLAECLIEAVELLLMLLKGREVDDTLDENDSSLQDKNNSGRGKRRPNADDRRAYERRAKIEAEKTREKQLLKWSEMDITFEKGDCQDSSDLSGRNPIVVQPVMLGYRVHDVLMDGGSCLDMLTVKTLDRMHISRSEVEPVTRSFHGVVSGTSATSIGQIWIAVQLGTPENFRTEDVLFHVVDNVEIPFTAILGRPAIAKFMAVLHHAYQCVKIRPNEVITIPSSGSRGHCRSPP